MANTNTQIDTTTNTLTDIHSDIYSDIHFHRFHQHLVDIQLTFTAHVDSPVVWLPSWLAGSYLMREFSRHITAVEYNHTAHNHTTHNRDAHTDTFRNTTNNRADKISKNEWQLTQVSKGDKVTVVYEVYCFDLSVRTAYVDSQRIFGNFSSLVLAVSGQENRKNSVNLLLPTAFMHNKASITIACGLPTECNTHDDVICYAMHANSYDELIDYPFEIAEQSEFEFATQDMHGKQITHRFFISGRHQLHEQRLKTDVQKICQTFNTWLEDTPFDDYTFMTFASGNDYGGLEHTNSTALVIPRSDLPLYNEREEPSDNYQRYLGLCSHEYFHAWWVKTVRPDVMMDVDLRQEAYTPLLWVFEGFTSYIDDFMLQASGVVNQRSYLNLLTAQINRYNQTAGRALQSVAESSFDAWIKLYRGDENTANAGISYYNKGALVALCLDLVMLKQTQGKYRLFDIVKAFYQRAKTMPNKRYGMNNENLTEVIGEFIDSKVWQDFYQKYVIGVDSLPVNELLLQNGLSISNETLANNTQPWGITTSDVPQGLKVNKINRDSVAGKAGLSAHDVIVAIDMLKASKEQLRKSTQAECHHQQAISCHVFRRDELMTFYIPVDSERNCLNEGTLGKVILRIDNQQLVNNWLEALDTGSV